MAKTNKRNTRRAASLFVLLALIFGSVVPSFAAVQRRRVRRRVTRTTTPPVRYYTVPANQVMRVRMDAPLNSGTARVGDRFSATTTEPVYGETGVEVIPVGSKVWGRVTVVNRATRHKPGNISVSFYQIVTPNQAHHIINGSLSSLQTDQVNADNEGTVKGRNNRKRDAVFVGGGAVAGGLIGAIAGGGKGAAIGAAAGAGAGAGTQIVTRGKSIRIPAETVLTFKLETPLRVTGSH